MSLRHQKWHALVLAHLPLLFKAPAHWRASSSATSSHAWTFKGATTLDREKAKSVRQEAIVGPSLPSSAPKPIIGPTLPPNASSFSNLAEHQNQQDEERDQLVQERIQRKNELKRKRKEDREEDASNRATGKDRLLEKRKEKRDAQSAYQRERDDPTGVELDDRSMFGTNDSFQAAIRARDRAQERKMGKNAGFKQEKQLIIQEKMAAMKSKEDETMAMLKAMAASKFGGSTS